MAVNETIVTGRKFRKLTDEATKLWQRISFWTKSSDVEFDDGENAENKVGAIKGITTDPNVTVSGYAADMKFVSQLNSNLLENKNLLSAIGTIYDTGNKTVSGSFGNTDIGVGLNLPSGHKYIIITNASNSDNVQITVAAMGAVVSGLEQADRSAGGWHRATHTAISANGGRVFAALWSSGSTTIIVRMSAICII